MSACTPAEEGAHEVEKRLLLLAGLHCRIAHTFVLLLSYFGRHQGDVPNKKKEKVAVIIKMALARSRCISYAYVCTSLVTMLLLAAHCSAIEEDGAAKAYDTDTFKQEVSTSNHFVMFYAPW